MKKFTLKTRVLTLFLLVGLVPMLAVALYIRFDAKNALHETSLRNLEGLRSSKAGEVERYFELVNNQVLTFAHDAMIEDAMKEFSASFNSFVEENEISSQEISKMKASVANYYRNQFGKEYESQNKKTYDVNSLVNNLNDTEIALQYHYISNNPNELGSKEKLDNASDKSAYSKHHKKYHRSIRELLQRFGYYDIFLIDKNSGHIVYSVFKELDYSTSLLSGSYKDTNFAEAFREALKINDKSKAILVDFKQYTPSYEAPASFIATPIWEGDEKTGVAIFQMPIDRVNAILGSRNGLGETGESYIVGSDKRMRSDSFLANEKLSVVASFRGGEEGLVNSPSIEEALSGKTASVESTNYLGDHVASSYQPINILGHKWALFVEMHTEEIFKADAHLNFVIGGLVAVFSLLIFGISIFFSKGLVNEISNVSTRLSKGAKAIAEMAINLSGESVKLSEAGTEQASSLQETAASIDEISAMVERNSDNAGNAASISKSSDEAARQGKEKVSAMISSIGDISEKQDEVNHHLEDNNKKMEDIVGIISQIADKTKVINDIVFQTKLLSFNASVEAARAGEHGKGFAVVAEEVGNLAAMSGKAADEISGMLESSTNHVQKIMAETKTKLDTLSKESKKSIESGQTVASECGKSLDQLLEQVVLVNEKVQEIATASAEQSTGVREVNTAMSQLDEVTQQNSVIAQEASVMSKDLRSEVINLESAVNDIIKLVEGDSSNAKSSSEHNNSVAQASPSKKQNKAVVHQISEKLDKAIAESESVTRSSQNNGVAQAKVVGLDSYGIPSSDDDRFEDI